MNTTQGPHGRVALLDRCTLTRECLARAIQCAGQIEVVGDFADLGTLLERLTVLAPNLVILSVSRVTEDWAAAVPKLRAPHGSPVVLLGEDVDEQVRQQCLAAGGAAVLDLRLATLEELMSTLRHVLGFDEGSLPGGMNGSDRAFHDLSPRERQVLAFLAGGADNLKIAAHLGVCERTVKGHVSALYRKLGWENRTQLALYARELGLRPPREL